MKTIYQKVFCRRKYGTTFKKLIFVSFFFNQHKLPQKLLLIVCHNIVLGS